MVGLDVSLHKNYETALKTLREQLNSRFKLLQQSQKKLDDQVYFQHFKSLLSCLPKEPPKNPEPLILALFKALSELAAQDVSLEAERSHRAIEAWIKVIPQCPDLFSHAPEHVLSILANSAISLSRQTDTHPTKFVETLSRVAGKCKDEQALKAVGYVAAWTAGWAAQRETAIKILSTFPDEWTRAIFPQTNFSGAQLADLWRANPWADHSRPNVPETKDQVCRVAGSFAGFGGQFMKVPTVESSGENFLVSDTIKHWYVTADVFGVSWARSSKAPKPLTTRLSVSQTQFKNTFSAAQNSHTTAVTINNSLRVYFIGRI